MWQPKNVETRDGDGRSELLLGKQTSHLKDFAMIQPTTSFKDNLQLLPAITSLARINLLKQDGTVVASIENQPGKQGSLAVYQYLQQAFGSLTPTAAEHGLAVFAEHTLDAKNRPGAHPNIDLLLSVLADKDPLDIQLITAD